MISYLENGEQNNFKNIRRAKHVLSRAEGTPRRKVTLRVISTPSTKLRTSSGRNPCFEQTEKSSS